MDLIDSDMEEQEDNIFEEFGWNYNRNEEEQGTRNNATMHHNSISPWNKENDGVTTLYRCNATDAKVLYIFDSSYKLIQSDQYDIGGAHTDIDTGLWFYFTTSSGPGRNYLMNLFVCQRQPGIFSMGISDSNTLTTAIYNNDKVRILSHELHWQKFVSTQPDEIHYIKTFRFSEEDRMSLLNMVLLIPISINISPRSMLMKDMVQKIKGELDFGEKLLKDQEYDFILKSSEGTEFRVHKIVIAAHSPKLRDLIRAEDCKSLSINVTDKQVELLLQYLYTGSIKDILNQQIEVLLVLAEKFQLNNLTELVMQAMKISISSENALDIAVLAEKYNCKDIQEVAFRYISHHPEVLESDAFSKIDDANVVKKLLRHIHVKTAQK